MNTMDKLFKTMKVVMGGLLTMIIAASVVPSASASQTGVDPMVQAAINARIKPVAQLNIGGAAATPATAAPIVVTSAGTANGKSVYSKTCFACHATGAAGSPKFGDKVAWKPRIAKGIPTLLNHAMHGFNAMPAKGGNSSLDEASIKAAIIYMTSNSK